MAAETFVPIGAGDEQREEGNGIAPCLQEADRKDDTDTTSRRVVCDVPETAIPDEVVEEESGVEGLLGDGTAEAPPTTHTTPAPDDVFEESRKGKEGVPLEDDERETSLKESSEDAPLETTDKVPPTSPVTSEAERVVSSTLPAPALKRPRRMRPKPTSPPPPSPPLPSEEEPHTGVDWLSKLITNTTFDEWLCIVYLSKYQHHPGCYAMLVKQLYTYSYDSVENYLPQLVCLYLWGAQNDGLLEQYLLSASSRSMHFALRLAWHLDADASTASDPVVAQRATTGKEKVESVAINRALPSRTKRVDPSVVDCKLLAREAAAKQRRCLYFNNEIQFISQITEVSLSLRLYPRELRDEILSKELDYISLRLPKMCVYIPLGTTHGTFCRLIRVPPRMCKVLNSRERAPYLALFEYLEGGTCQEPEPIEADSDTESIGEESKSEADGVVLSGPSEILEDHFGPTANPSAAPSPPTPRTVVGSPCVFDDPQVEMRLNSVFGEAWNKRVERIRSDSPHGEKEGWGVVPVIVKGGDDMRQEVLAMQLINAFDKIWSEAKLPVKLIPYGVMVTSDDSGIIELVTDAVSIDAVKKTRPEDKRNLADYWGWAYGSPSSPAYRVAQRNFIESMAGYSVVTYLLQLKDRHNANILLRRDGHVVHIDFGFMLTNSPGGVNFESMPFKLSQEFVDVMGGVGSDMFQYFCVLVYSAFKHARKHMERIISIVEMMSPGPNLPCFGGDAKAAVDALKSRFMPDAELSVWVRDAIDQSVDNWRARNYDRFQRWQNGIL